MAQKHNSYEEQPMTRYGTIQGPSRRYRRLRHPSFPAAVWTSKNPLLQRGEIGFEIDTHQAKIGDGTTYWNDLPYALYSEYHWGDIVGDINDQTDLKNALDAKQDTLTAGTNINITGTTISATDTTYTGSDGITLTGTNFTNSGVRSVASGTANGTISVNTNGTSADVAVTGLGSAAYTASSDYATAAQGAKADTAVQPADLSSYVTKDTTQTITGEKTFSGLMNYSAGKTYILAGNGGTKLGYWSYDIDGGNNITLQTMTASTRNINFKTNNGGKVTYNGSEIAKVSDLPSVMTGATAGNAGTNGLVPAPAAGDQGKFLQGDGTWANPTIPTVNDATLTIQKNGTNVATFTANASSNVTADISVPTDTSDLTNGAGYITGITSADVTSALGYTPYSDANPNGYTSNIGTVTSVNNTSPDGAGNVSLTIPTVNDATITVTQNGVSVGSFTLNQASGDTIALTDTTYSNFTGASVGDAGASGLVPAPSAGDQAKFLQGDGTWANPTVATAWGNITGTLLDQTDLQSALDAKLDADKAYYPDLFDWKWADHEISDMSWLRADTFSWQDGTVYSDAYQHLVDDISGKTLQTETVGGTTISFYLADDGHKICPATQESNVTAIYTATGVAWYYILDTDNTRFKLPRTQFGVTGLRDAVGKYVAPGLPNITGAITQGDSGAGTYNASRSGAFRAINTSPSRGYMFDRLVATNNIGDIGFNAGWSNSIYGNGTTVQPPATQQYLYFYVGQFSQSAVEQTAGLNASLFNNKVDIGHQVIAFQAPNAGNNYTWYRKYADGWVEQGGVFTASVSSGSSNNNCNLPITMKDTHYAVSVGGGFISGTAFMKWNVVGKNTTYVAISGDTGSVGISGYTTSECSWQVSGMAA